MCYEEFISYQCGHRSLGVLRPCPSTTRGHNFPVCSTGAVVQFNATTMCYPCERTLHSRWVLIREWEHRWLHERGACECDVIFPGLLNRPRVIGSSSGDEIHCSQPVNHSGFLPPAAPAATSAAPGPSAPGGSPSAALTVGSSPSAPAEGTTTVPALFTETVAGDEHHIAIRLPGLYAAEWRSDHRARHQSGQCACPTSFRSVRPEVDENEMTANERELLQDCRTMAKMSLTLNADEISHRMAQIESAFGTFSSVPLGIPQQPRGRLIPATTSGSPLTFLRAADVVPSGQVFAVDVPESCSLATLAPTSSLKDAIFSGARGPFTVLPTIYETTSREYRPKTTTGTATAAGALVLPICGLPVGAGPEGVSHMPNWYNCRLARPTLKRRASF